MIQLLRATAWRKSRGLGLTWHEVDWEGQAIRLSGRRPRSGEPRVLPFALVPALRALLEARWQARHGVLVFHQGDGRPIGSFRRAWASVCKRAGVDGVLVGDLRRSAARDLVSAGVPQQVVMMRCGWETNAMFGRYAIVDEKALAEAVARRFATSKHVADTGAPASPPASLSSSPVISAA